MPPAESIGDQLVALNKLRDDPRSAEAHELLRAAVRGRSNHVLARAVEIIIETGDANFCDDLTKAYRRLMINPLKADPGCIGKTAIVRGLVQLQYDEPDLFREGVTYTQPEPVFGGRKDTAAELRATCALGLVGCVGNLEVLNCCAIMLCDPCAEAREGAAHALAALDAAEGAALLRLKLLSGDTSANVIGECCTALLQLDPQQGTPFVIQLLDSPEPDVVVQAGLALGASRRPEVLQPLRAAWELASSNVVRGSLLLCIALLHTADANAFLLSLIRADDLQSASDAIKALSVLEKDRDLRQQVQAAVNATENDRLLEMFEQEWKAK